MRTIQFARLAIAIAASMTLHQAYALPLTEVNVVGFEPTSDISKTIIGCGMGNCENHWQFNETMPVPKFDHSGYRLLSTNITFSMYMELGAHVLNNTTTQQWSDAIVSMHTIGFFVGPLWQDKHYGGTTTCVIGAKNNSLDPDVCSGEKVLAPLQSADTAFGTDSYTGSIDFTDNADLLVFVGSGTWGLGANGSANVIIRNTDYTMPTWIRTGEGGTFIVTYEYCNFRTDENCSERIPEPSSLSLMLGALLAFPVAGWGARLRKSRCNLRSRT